MFIKLIIFLGIGIMLFGGKSYAQHKEEWASYFSLVNNEYASIFVDLGIKPIAPIKKQKKILWVWVYFKNPREDGLSSDQESSFLFKIEDEISEKLKSKYNTTYAGRITTQGRREFYFYSSTSKNYENEISKIMSKFSGYKFDFGIENDPNWNQYSNVLYPTPEQHQIIQDYNVLATLEKHGDNLTKSRIINHWAYFKNERTKNQFISEADKLGFKVTEGSLTFEKKNEFSYGVTIEREDLVDYKSIVDVTVPLFRLAQKYGGEYDGWESPVIK